MREQIESWLRGNDAALAVYSKDRCMTYMRLRKRAHIDCIYEQSAYHAKETKISGKFEYAGIYNRLDGQIYDAQNHLQKLFNETEGKLGKSKSVIISDAVRRIKEIVDAAIDNNRDNLRIKSIDEINEPRFLENLEEHKHSGAAETARRLLLDGETPEDITLYCTYKADDISDIDFLDCITDFEAYCERVAAAYIEDTQEYMYIKFLANDATKAAMLALMGDADNDVHIIAAIKRVLEKNTYKTVNVTTVIDGKELTFKTLASDLNRDPSSRGGYSAWNISAQDRKKFEQLYGRHSEYSPHDIKKITYGKTVIYEKTDK